LSRVNDPASSPNSSGRPGPSPMTPGPLRFAFALLRLLTVAGRALQRRFEREWCAGCNVDAGFEVVGPGASRPSSQTRHGALGARPASYLTPPGSRGDGLDLLLELRIDDRSFEILDGGCRWGRRCQNDGNLLKLTLEMDDGRVDVGPEGGWAGGPR